ncbi:immunoglobulin lambda-1 light chain-like isoform X3 [Podarcis lilfordi]|nr:immunoglobulin lambda-1 light chain-like isoform X3 [Podarcis lilfordi]
MAWILVLVTCLSYCSGVTSQTTLIQPASESVLPGQTVKLSCSRSSGSLYAYSWYQQKGGQAPRFVFYASGTRGDGIPDRFAASTSGNTYYLTISNVQAEDEAVYYCVDWVTGSNVFHGGTI